MKEPCVVTGPTNTAALEAVRTPLNTALLDAVSVPVVLKPPVTVRTPGADCPMADAPSPKMALDPNLTVLENDMPPSELVLKPAIDTAPFTTRPFARVSGVEIVSSWSLTP